jgi:hypothetical protein
MSTTAKAAVLALVIAVPAFLIAPMLFPPAPGPGPSSTQMPFFLLLTVFDSLLLGIGVAFVVFGWPLVRRVAPGSRAIATAMFIGVAWLTISWYPHIGLHMSAFGSTFGGLLVIDYLFHVPLYVVGLLLIWGLASYLQSVADKPASSPPQARSA